MDPWLWGNHGYVGEMGSSFEESMVL